MSIIDVQVFNCLAQLDREIEHVENLVGDIEAQLQAPHSSADYYQLFMDLDKAFRPIKQMKETARSMSNCGTQFLERLDKLEGKCPSLFGDLITLAVDREVVEITSEAENLQNSLLNENMLSVAKKVDSLKQHISTLRHDNALSQKNLTVITSVERFVEMVEKFIEVSKDAPADRPVFAAQRAEVRPQIYASEMDPVGAELLMEIFETAELFESGHTSAAKKKERLPPALQRRLEALKQQFEASLGLSSDKLYSTALLALAMELTQGKKLDNPLEEIAAYYGDLEGIEASLGSSNTSWPNRSVGG